MKKLLTALACALLFAGCDLTVPLVESPDTEIDASLVGLWQRWSGDGKVELLLVLPLNEREYLVSYPSGSKDAMFARGCVCRAVDRTLVQLGWLGTDRLQLPENDSLFQFVSRSAAGDTITVRLLNSEAMGRIVASTEELAKALAKNGNPLDLFREAMVFARVTE